ncbi:Zinc-type alcohol dehydrogenase-like protein [Fusarium oxysporum f. sp. albedinis]|nr:Zinc-type alcohol dehydrogenase-like protein [Fusarium oxysporum f. sp. albedinis]
MERFSSKECLLFSFEMRLNMYCFLLSRRSLDMALEGQGYLPTCILDFTVWLEEKKTSLGLKLMRSEATMLKNWRLL